MESIQVAVRLRPDPEPSIWSLQQQHVILNNKDILAKRPISGQRCVFAFDQCFGSEDKNKVIYQKQCKDMIMGSLSGINATIFLYGQTGSGKTYTMLGKPQDEGILIQSFKDLFEQIEGDLNKTYVLRCSYIEIYNEQIFDLLKPANRLSETLIINEDAKKDFFIKGVIEQSVSTLTEILEVLQKGEANRHYAQTAMNHNSSRSHAIFRLQVQSITNNFIRNYRREQSQRKFQTIDQIEFNSQVSQQSQGALVTESVLTFVDLAGSEKVSNHFDEQQQLIEQETNRRVKEGQYINKSLFFLTQVIYMKAEDKTHVPFRNSSLTKILRSSLGGNSRTLIILCLNTSVQQYEYTMSTIRFGMNAKKIESKIQVNIHSHDDDEALKIIISDYEKKIHDYEKQRLEEKEQFDIQISQLKQEKDELQQRIVILNKDQFQKIPPIYKEITWQDRFNQDMHIDTAGDIMQTTKRVNRPPKHDCQGKIVLAALKCSQNNYKLVQNNLQNIKKEYLVLQQQYISNYNILQETQVQFKLVTDKYNQLLTLSEDMIFKLQFNSKELSDQLLSEYFQFYSSQLHKIQSEMVRRNFINDIKYSFNLEQFEKYTYEVDYQKFNMVDLEDILNNQIEQPNLNMSKSSIESNLESDESFHIQFPQFQEKEQDVKVQEISQNISQENISLAESHFKTALKNFINEVDNKLPVTHMNTHAKTSISQTKKVQHQKYKTPDTKFKNKSNSSTSIRSKMNNENTNNSRSSISHVPKPKTSRMKTEELSALLHNC
ncbi:hypothetical protein pb186bvf_019169 [Paramecium bursaria]